MLIGDRVAEEKQGSLRPVHNTVNESWSGSFIVLRKTNVTGLFAVSVFSSSYCKNRNEGCKSCYYLLLK